MSTFFSCYVCACDLIRWEFHIQFPTKDEKVLMIFPWIFIRRLKIIHIYFVIEIFFCRKCFCCFSNENKKKLHELAQIYISETEPLVYKKFYAHSSSGMLENESSTISILTLFINCKELLNPDCCCFRWAALNFQPFRNVLLCFFFSVYYVRITFFHCRNTLCLEQKCDGFFFFKEKIGISQVIRRNKEQTSRTPALKCFYFFSAG